jgi:hypothetical protein
LKDLATDVPGSTFVLQAVNVNFTSTIVHFDLFYI